MIDLKISTVEVSNKGTVSTENADYNFNYVIKNNELSEISLNVITDVAVSSPDPLRPGEMISGTQKQSIGTLFVKNGIFQANFPYSEKLVLYVSDMKKIIDEIKGQNNSML